ncbi:MAG: chemotaxis response regulator protein-glutamate methylesterase [Gammaproteobacteria bacterium]
MKRIKVLIVDDSAVVRQVVSAVLGADARMEVIGACPNPLLAIAHMRRQWPDVVVLDIEMPQMDGLTFLRKIMAERPVPVIICSTLTEAGARTTLEAMAAGAVATIQKPRLGLKSFLNEASEDLVSAVLAASRANVGLLAARAPLPVREKLSADAIAMPPSSSQAGGASARMVAIGASTGGTQALEALLSALPAQAPAIAIVQHMPEKFTSAFAERLDSVCRIRVAEARTGMPLVPGQALVAPGGRHLLVKRQGERYIAEVIDGPLINRHRPSVDVLFRSVARNAGANALGIIMTGMGDDGAAGLAEMRAAGASTLAQDEASCVVYGMPKEAVKRGGVERSLPLSAIPLELLRQR